MSKDNFMREQMEKVLGEEEEAKRIFAIFTPLSSLGKVVIIQSLLSTLADRLPPGEQDKFVDYISSEVKKALRLVREKENAVCH